MFVHTRDNAVWIDSEKFTLADVLVVRSDYALPEGISYVDHGYGFVVVDSEVNQKPLPSSYTDICDDLETRVAEVVTARTARLDAAQEALEDSFDYMAIMRGTRDDLMTACDWTQLADVVSSGRLTSQQVSDYATYRQSLADMPQDNPNTTTKALYDALVWPTVP